MRMRVSVISECGQSTVHTHRIVGGTETAVNEFPWIAGIVKKDEGSEHRYKVGLIKIWTKRRYAKTLTNPNCKIAAILWRYGYQLGVRPDCRPLHGKVRIKEMAIVSVETKE